MLLLEPVAGWGGIPQEVAGRENVGGVSFLALGVHKETGVWCIGRLGDTSPSDGIRFPLWFGRFGDVGHLFMILCIYCSAC